MFLNQPLNDAGGEQHGIDIVRQRRAVMTMTVNALDGIAHVKSIKRHKLTMPQQPRRALTSIKRSHYSQPGKSNSALRPQEEVSILSPSCPTPFTSHTLWLGVPASRAAIVAA